MYKHPAIVFDIDGTLADIAHRRHFVATKPKNWKAFNKASVNDKPNEPIVFLYKMLEETCKTHTMIIVSGREEVYRDQTETWLLDHEIRFDSLYMRPKNDYRADDIIKEEILKLKLLPFYDIKMVFDDRDRVVSMWRRNGLTCLQVAEGHF